VNQVSKPEIPFIQRIETPIGCTETAVALFPDPSFK
jgi:hypothetical protein